MVTFGYDCTYSDCGIWFIGKQFEYNSDVVGVRMTTSFLSTRPLFGTEANGCRTAFSPTTAFEPI